MIDIRPANGHKNICSHKESDDYTDIVSGMNSLVDVNRLLSYGASYRRVHAEEIIFMEGSELVYYFQLVSGSVRWINYIDDGRAFIQEIILPGECFGELPLFDGCLYSATAIASKDSLLIRLPRTIFLQMLEENPDVHFAFSQMMARRMQFKFLMLKEISFCEPTHRIAVLLNYLKESGRHYCKQCNKLTLTRQQLADMTGLRVETVIRAIKYLEAEGKIDIQHGKVYYKGRLEDHIS